MGFQDIIHWWPRAGFQRQVRKALESTVSSPIPPRAFLDGSGVIIVPSDPVEAALSAIAIGDFCKRLERPVRLAGPPGSLRWIPAAVGTPIEISENLGKRSFGEWLEFHRADRADWALLASTRPTALEEACLGWLGIGARFAPFGACRSSNAVNVQIQSDPGSSLDARMRRFMRVLQPELSPLPASPSARPQGPVLLEIPPDLPEKGSRCASWLRLITNMATHRSLLLAHSEALPPVIQDQVRSLGPRVALVHLSTAHEAQELARRARCWIGTRTPASALAALEGCPIHLVGGPATSRDFPHPELLTVSGKIGELDSRLVE